MTAVVSPSRAARPHPAAEARRRRRRQSKSPYLFLAPFAVVFVTMLLAPLVYSAYLSLFTRRIIGGLQFVGLDNYREAITDTEFLSGLWRMVGFFLVQVPLTLLLALAAALVLDSGRLALPKLFRVGLFVPYAVPAVVGALIWGYLYGPNFGPIAEVAGTIGLPAPGFLTPDGILGSIANIAVWGLFGYNMIIYYAVLRAVPPELYEAAAVDGAGPVKTALHVKIPHLLPAMGITVLFSLIGTFQLFNEPNVLQTVAPSAIGRSWTPNLYAFNLAFADVRVEYAAAVSFLLGAFIIAVTLGGLLVLAIARKVRS